MAKIALISTDIYIYSHGIRAISAYLKSKGHETIILSMPYPAIINEENLRKNDFKAGYPKSALKNMRNLVKNYDIIGISSMASTSFRAIQIINALKPLKKPIIWGGIFPTTFPEYCIKHSDIICVGEGELALEELARKIDSKKTYHKVKNLWFRKNNKTIKNPLRNLIDINLIPVQDFDKNTNFILEKDNKFSKLNQRHMGKWLYYHGIRGCCFSCEYCSNCKLQEIYAKKGPRIRKRDIKLMVNDLEALLKKFPKVEFIWFTDDDINMRTEQELQEFSKLYKEKINLPFRNYMNPLTVNEKKLELLKKAGMKQIEMGLQSGSNRINHEIYGRPITSIQALKAARIINKYSKNIWPPAIQIMATNPYETQQDVQETINLLRKIPTPYYLHVFGIVFFPGTPLYDKAVRERIINKFEDSAYNVDYTDLKSHFKIKHQNLYLNSIIFLMSHQNTKHFHGLIPKFAFRFLLNKKTINFFNKHYKLSQILNCSVLKIGKLRDYLTIIFKEIWVIFNNIKGFFYLLMPQAIKQPLKKAINSI